MEFVRNTIYCYVLHMGWDFSVQNDFHRIHKVLRKYILQIKLCNLTDHGL